MASDIKNQQENKSTHEKNNISRDIIELQQAEKKQAEKNLRLANFIHQDSVRTISISMSKPCNNMFALSTILCEQEDEPNKKSTMAAVAAYAKDLMYYSRNIVNFTSYPISLATTSVVPAPTTSRKFNPEALVNNVINKLMLSSKNKGIRFANNFTKDIPTIIIGDGYRLEAILTQLITNAIKYTEQGGITLTTYFFPGGTKTLQKDREYNSRNTIDAEKVKDILQLIVHDTGVGMSEKQRQSIYQQLNGLEASDDELATDSNSESNLELGLGLSLVKQFIHEINGKIDVNSRHGKSTTFTLQIPVKLP
ncbi:sensor histidine kinase [Candidatus Tisiphia endosymbiont of Oplodontha viridula]|uniref:sensor histidine kinase n=1 Tax=Candidatus Tisiphia endosymbiont of Oplodontha viridula TaxID=3077925 RepID=UPI0035C8AC11